MNKKPLNDDAHNGAFARSMTHSSSEWQFDPMFGRFCHIFFRQNLNFMRRFRFITHSTACKRYSFNVQSVPSCDCSTYYSSSELNHRTLISAHNNLNESNLPNEDYS